MPRGNYIEGNDNAFANQLKTFKNNIGSYAATLGLSAAQVAAQAADCDYFEYVLKCLAVMQTGAQQWTAWKDLSRDGGVSLSSGAPTDPVFPSPVPAVPPGIEARFRALVRQIKASPNYNGAIGTALGIEAARQSAPDLTTLRPEIDVTLNGNQVLVGWGWQGNSAYLDMCEIQVDRGDGKGFGLLAFDSTPNYVDTAPFPAAPTKWTYRAIYRLGDSQVGQWSQPASLTVPG
ncbi:MAG: hypothetical protein HZA90_02370 [Verrucomicrobia bacterium]|nr:hypothetical protein [Verrucomicrobiota bacterium]